MGHLSLKVKIVIFLISELVFLLAKEDTSHVFLDAALHFYSKKFIHFNFFFIFIVSAMQMNNIFECIQPTSALFWYDGSYILFNPPKILCKFHVKYPVDQYTWNWYSLHGRFTINLAHWVSVLNALTQCRTFNLYNGHFMLEHAVCGIYSYRSEAAYR